MTWYDRWKAFLRTKRHYPDSGNCGYASTTHTTPGETAIIRWPSLAPKQSASALPRNLKRLCEAKGWSVAELAGAAQVSASTVRAMETSGNYDMSETERALNKKPTYDPNPTLTSLLAVAQALGVGIGELVEESNNA